jgi:hypothetical protein
LIHRSLLRFAGARYLWWGLALVAASIVLYSTQGGLNPPKGDTWQGYVLGSIGALLIVWLTLLGIRKRRYASRIGSVEGWTSAHVYLGLAVVFVATLHCAFRFHWNVHTLAYVLMCAVVASGIFGIFVYAYYPRQLSENRQGGARSEMFAELLELNKRSMEIAGKCDPNVNTAVKSAIERTAIGGSAGVQLLGIDRSWYIRADHEVSGGKTNLTGNADQQPLIDYVANRVPRTEKRAEAANLQALVLVLSQRQKILRRIRRDVQLQGLLKIWLYLHVPLTLALIAALVVHILTSFMYW